MAEETVRDQDTYTVWIYEAEEYLLAQEVSWTRLM